MLSKNFKHSIEGEIPSRTPQEIRKEPPGKDQKPERRLSNQQSIEHLSSSSQSGGQIDEEEKKHKFNKDLKEFRAKTIDRIIHKRRESDAKHHQILDEKQKERNAFRMNWKENLRRQRVESIVNEVDKRLVRSSIASPALVNDESTVNNILKLRSSNEKQLHQLTSDLADIDDVLPMDRRKDPGVYTISLKGTSNNKDNSHRGTPTRNFPTVGVTITAGRMRSASIEFNSGKPISLGANFLQYICSFDLNIRNKLPEPWNREGGSSSRMNFKESKSSTNQVQITELIDDILRRDKFSSPPVKRGSKILATPFKTAQRLPKGYMLEVFQEICEAPSSLPPTTHRLSRSMSLDESMSYAKSPFALLSAVKESKHENPTMSSFVDGCFLLGPSQADVLSLVHARAEDPNFVKTYQQTNPIQPDEKNNSRREKLSSTQTKHILTPKVLYRNEFNFPPEMMQLLPSYCFPSDIEVLLDSVNLTKANRMANHGKDPLHTSTTINTQATTTNNNTSDALRRSSISQRKKMRAFFPSDETLIKSEEEITPTKDNPIGSLTPPPPHSPLPTLSTVPSMMPIQPTVSTLFKAPFIILLGDHTYQQYCLGFHLPVVFYDPMLGLTVQTTYCLCFLTKFAFFSFLTHLIQQIDDELKIFAFNEAVPEFDPTFALHPQLRILHDLVCKLKKISLPLYPYLIRNDSLLPDTARNILRSHSDKVPASSFNGAKQGEEDESGKINQSAKVNTSPVPVPFLPPGVTATSDYLAILHDISFSFSLGQKTSSSGILSPQVGLSTLLAERKHFTFPRTFYQKYYSSYLSHLDLALDSQSQIHYYEKHKAENASVGRNHVLEKDREDSFFILQWALPTLLKYLPLDQIVLALGCAMTEMKLLVKHKDLHVVSSVILALIHLLKPLKWCSPVIVTLPDQLIDLIESPVPIVLGLQKLPPGFALPERYVVIDPGERIVHLNPLDLVQSQSILLPNGSKLVTALKSSAEAILKLNAKTKRTRVKPVTISPLQIPDRLSPAPTLSPFSFNASISPIKPSEPARKQQVGDVNKTGIAEVSTSNRRESFDTVTGMASTANVPLPIELDSQNPDCVDLLGFIQQFASTVHNHILAILNTSIHLQHVEKQAARAKRRVVANKPLDTVTSAPIRSLAGNGSQKPNKNTPPPAKSESLDVGMGSFDREDINQFSKKQASTKHKPVITGGGMTPPRNRTNSGPPRLTPPREDRNFDEYSEITLTDFHVDDNDPASNASFCSTSSSLPSLQSDAPLLAIKEIGQNGLKFVNQLSDTQMYSNYIQSLKLHSSTTTVDGSVIGSTDHGHLGSDSRGTYSAERRGKSLDPVEEEDPNLLADDLHHDLLEEEESFDAIANIFEILLTGSLPISETLLEACRDMYQRLYPNSPADPIDVSNYNPDWLRKIIHVSKTRSRLERMITKRIKSIATSELQSLALFDDLQSSLRQCNGLICNGFCNTVICSEICIELWTAKVRKLRHRQAAYEIVAKKYEKKRSVVPSQTMSGVHSAGNGLQAGNELRRLTLESTGTMSIETEKTSPKIEFITKVGPHYESIRHGRETESQYQQRKKINRDSVIQKELEDRHYTHHPFAATSRPSHSSSVHQPHRRSSKGSSYRSSTKHESPRRNRESPRSNHARTTAVSFFRPPSVLDLPPAAVKSSPQLLRSVEEEREKQRQQEEQGRKIKRSLYLKKRKFISEESSATSAHPSSSKRLYALARYYARREEKLVHKYVRRMQRRIHRFLFRFIALYRRYKLRLGIIFFQAAVRGYFTRQFFCNQLLDDLIAHKQLRLCSKIRIRQFLRTHAERILKNYHRRRLFEQRKRLSNISIPIAPPQGSALANAKGHSTGDSTVGRSDNRLSPTPRSNSPLPSQKSAQPPVRYINDPTLPKASSATGMIQASRTNSSSSVTLGEKKVSNKKQLTVDTGNEIDEAEVFVRGAQGRKESSQSTYTDRAKEFLQFGNLLRRSSLPTPKFPARRKNSTDLRKSDGVAIPPTDEFVPSDSGPPSTMSVYTINDFKTPPESKLPSEANSPARPEVAVFPVDETEPSPTQLAISNPAPFLRSPSDGQVPPPLPRRSLEPGSPNYYSDPTNAKFARSKSQSSDVPDRSAGSAPPPEMLNSRSSSLHQISHSGSEDPELLVNQSNLRSAMLQASREGSASGNHPRGSFFSRGFQSILRSRSTDSNQSNMRQKMSVGPAINSGSRDSEEYYDTMTTGTTASRVVTDERSSSVAPPRRFSGFFDRSSEIPTPASGAASTTSSSIFPSFFGFGSHHQNSHATHHQNSPARESRSHSDETRAIGGVALLDHSAHSTKSSHHSDAGGSQATSKTGGRGEGEHNLLSRATASLLGMEDEDPVSMERTSKDHDFYEDEEENPYFADDFGDGEEIPQGIFYDLTKEFEHYPLITLGAHAMEYINRQQIILIKKMWSHLLRGVEVIKHSRSGKPKTKMLFCDYAMTRLYWRRAGSKPDLRLSLEPATQRHDWNEEGDIGSNAGHSEETISDTQPLHPQHSNVVLPKPRKTSIFSKTGFSETFRRTSFTKSNTDREIFLKDILSIASDGKSEVFQRSFMKQYFQQEEDTSLLSLTTVTRTLDLELSTPLWTEIFPALQIIINYYQISLTGHLSLTPEVKDQLQYIYKNGMAYSQYPIHTHHGSHHSLAGTEKDDGMIDDVTGDVFYGGKKMKRYHTPPPNTPQYQDSTENGDHEKAGEEPIMMLAEQKPFRNSLKQLFPITEDHTEDDF